MEKIIIKQLDIVSSENKRGVNKSYLINNEIVSGEVDRLAVEPLRILESLLIEKGLKIKKTIENNDPWNIKEMQIECEEYIAIDNIIKEIMEYRCCPEYRLKWTDIIRQLPYNIMMQVSNAIMNYGKDAMQHQMDMSFSNAEWNYYSFMARQQGISIHGNPNEINDNIVISKDEPEMRKHLIYRSARGGYNIKTQNYRDSSMDHYCWIDSRKWD